MARAPQDQCATVRARLVRYQPARTRALDASKDTLAETGTGALGEQTRIARLGVVNLMHW